ncbi:ABC transporter ATP-binding protein [Paraburkholderia lycopersici]|uniref:Branched-chain amino acid transport system ATP-binding protein n=1 Tax=Paraburkholderia lycopersici TaxID=416944 RepID=A0A1G6HGI7_9BURK|nr:ABC transporter ATP-binding protein [Paraburkholderia lycopersici]SDB93045.1 branched-chain amino acid transport system ATP-binding protein [Paraburkholderia lycopersici]
MSQAAPALLAVDGISLSFGGVKAITDISFEVAAGEICALIGPNGAGKSSLLNVINGVYRPQQGTVRFDGHAYRRMDPYQVAHRGIARTFQNLALFRRMTVFDNVLTGRNLHRRSTWLEQTLHLGRAHRDEAEQRRQAERVIETLELHSYRDAVAGTLSYGLQKRVELARALAAEPRLLLLDEPMAGMNAEEKHAMAGYILDASEYLGLTVVLIDHDIGVVMGLSDHVVVLDYGRKIADGRPEEVRTNPEVLAAYLGTRH